VFTEVDILCIQTDERLTSLPDNFSKLAPYLGLGERRTAPELLLLKEPDPLGASAVPSVTLESVSSGQPGEQNSFGIEQMCVELRYEKSQQKYS
jgi:hypothetical protein